MIAPETLEFVDDSVGILLAEISAFVFLRQAIDGLDDLIGKMHDAMSMGPCIKTCLWSV